MPRKTDGGRREAGRQLRASMRPRPDAAENSAGREEDAGVLRASMRPRPDAAENAGLERRQRLPDAGFNEAAARCRGKRTLLVQAIQMPNLASMRPRPDAAENGAPPRRSPPSPSLQ